MKIEVHKLKTILARPEKYRIFLFYGPDAGLVREYAKTVALQLAGSLDDPFRIAILRANQHDRLEDEASTLSLNGGNRVVWLREANDSLVTPLQQLLDQQLEISIILEANELGPRSKLRIFMEKHKDTTSYACYPEEGQVLENTIVQLLEKDHIKIEADALRWFASHLGPDRTAIRNEVEKLALYAGNHGRLDMTAVQDCTADSATQSINDAVFTTLAGNVLLSDTAVDKALTEGSPITLIRILINHIHRLRRSKQLMENGLSMEAAIRSLKPPVFFKHISLFRTSLTLWSSDRLSLWATRTQKLEFTCKQTNIPDNLLCRHHMAKLVQQAAYSRCH